jgi:FMN reductase
MSQYRIAAVTGNLHSPSRTVSLANLALCALGSVLPARAELIDLSGALAAPAPAAKREQLPAALQELLQRVEGADALVVATPVYRGSYTGLFKHFFDLVAADALVDVPVILAAAGGDARHSLIIDHALRPLFAFFRAQPVPTGLYSTEADFSAYELIGSALQQRAALAAGQVARLLAGRTPRLELARAAHSAPGAASSVFNGASAAERAAAR